MRTYGEGFNQELEGLPGKPGRLIQRSDGRQPGAVVLDLNVDSDGIDPYGLPIRPPRIDQPRTPGQVRDR
jgi:hypothetical protein